VIGSCREAHAKQPDDSSAGRLCGRPYLIGQAMISTEERPNAIPSSLVDLRDLSLAQLPDLNADILGAAIERILPESPAVPVAAFNSAI
jgi:FXSXX-COOH protein